MTKIIEFKTLRAGVIAALSAAMLAASMPAASAVAATPHQSTDALASGLQDRVDKIVAAGAPGAALVVRDGDQTQLVAAGLADVETGRELEAADRFRVGSVTKTFVATLVLQLVATGDLDLDATVADYRPRLIPDGDKITLRQLLNHTSGLFNYTDDAHFLEAALAGSEFRPRKLIAYGTSHDPLFPPGTDWSYSNTNYVVLGILARTAGAQPVRQQLISRILAPLDLESTSFPVYDRTIRGRHARGYERDGELIDVTEFFSPSWAWAAGAVVSNPADLTAFYRGLLAGDLVEPALLDEMMETVPIGEGVGYGLGIEAIELSCGTAWGHGGDVPGYHALVISTEDGERQVAVLVNIGASHRVRTAVMRAAVQTLCDTDDAADAVPMPTLDRSWFAGG